MAGLLAALSAGAGWGQELDALVSPGPLARAHAEQGGLRNCVACHAPGKGVEPARCLACHKELAERVRAGRGFHRDKAQECASCHADHQGVDFALVRWDPRSFDHAQTGYPLLGLHRTLAECGACHKPERAPARAKGHSFLLGDTRCATCHADPHRGQLGADCQRCHAVEVRFRDVRFDHARTAYPLRGAHQTVACERCHAGQKWKGLAFARCADCHKDPHRPSLGAGCERCHGPDAWKKTSFDHERTAYPLRGRHRAVECRQCHAGGSFAKLPFGSCTDCHRRDPHLGQLRADCASCHGVGGFRPASFDHAVSAYPLTGRHQPLACDKCHRLEEGAFPAGRGRAVRYRPLATACAACHQDPHRGQLAQGCEVCHATAGFGRDRLLFQHDRHARFPLRGKHAGVSCEQCHRREQPAAGAVAAVRFRPLAQECGGCHADPHAPAAATAGTTAQCQRCHAAEGFRPAAFDHQKASFPLTGRHAGLVCERCHAFAAWKDRKVVRFQHARRRCVDCHRSPHASRHNRCEECHAATSWRVRAF